MQTHCRGGEAKALDLESPLRLACCWPAVRAVRRVEPNAPALFFPSLSFNTRPLCHKKNLKKIPSITIKKMAHLLRVYVVLFFPCIPPPTPY